MLKLFSRNIKIKVSKFVEEKLLNEWGCSLVYKLLLERRDKKEWEKSRVECGLYFIKGKS